MSHSACVLWLSALFAPLAAFADPTVLSSDKLSATVDSAFPRVIEYRWKSGDQLLHGTPVPLTQIAINGTNYTPKVTFATKGPAATYTLDIAELKVAMTIEIAVERNACRTRVTEIRESGTDRVRSVALPGHFAVSAKSDQPGASLVGSSLPKADETWAIASHKPDAKPQGRTYAVLHTDGLAATVLNNVLLDSERLHAQVITNAAGTFGGLWSPVWTYREIDSEIVALPFETVLFADDLNGDKSVDWQDGAIAYRAVAPRPFGAEFVTNRLVSQIAMNFASWAQHPFLRVLDVEKKVYLYTDGLGQDVQFKGYQSEGHDSSHPDYGGNVGVRQGGRDELDFVMKRGKDFNVRSGVHINATEYYPEAQHYTLNLVNTNKKGWAWIDQSYYTDLRADVTNGTLYSRLDELRADLPNLDWAYLDVYFGTGWNAHKLATKVNSLGIALYTEFPGYLERFITWNHTSQDWTQKVWGDGMKSRLARFIRHQDKDTFEHDPLVRGSNDDGFMGWHSQRSIPGFVRSVFTVNLPSKYLQHFSFVTWTSNKAVFADGVVAVQEDGVHRIYRNGVLVSEARYPKANRPPEGNKLFLPWAPAAEAKIYHWTDSGGRGTWTLPASWAKRTQVYVYRLSDTGRTLAQTVAVVDGKVTFDSEPATPYVLYPTPAPAQADIIWGEGGLVYDPGFDSHSFRWWKPSSDAADCGHVRIVNDDFGQTHAEVKGNGGAGALLTQPIFNLKGGRTYSASVWVELDNGRSAAIGVHPFRGYTAAEWSDRSAWKIVRVSSEETKGEGEENGRVARVLDGDASTYWHSQWQAGAAKPPHEIVFDLGAARTIRGFKYLARKGQANGTIKDFELYASEQDGTWGEPVAKGALTGAGELKKVMLATPARARFLRFVMLSEAGGQNFGSMAEFDVIGEPDPAPAKPGQLGETWATIRETKFTNFSDNADKYMTRFQRIKVLFDVPAGVDAAELCLRADRGPADSVARFDDVRVVEAKRSPAGKHAYFEDFENVDEGWGPFLYGFKGNTRIHLAEAHPPYTDDVVDGKYSLKVMDEPQELVLRTGAMLPLAPETAYKLTFDYLVDKANQYKLVVRTDAGKAEVAAQALPGEGRKKQTCTVSFKTPAQDDCWIGFEKSDKEAGILSIDNLALDVVK